MDGAVKLIFAPLFLLTLIVLLIQLIISKLKIKSKTIY